MSYGAPAMSLGLAQHVLGELAAAGLQGRLVEVPEGWRVRVSTPLHDEPVVLWDSIDATYLLAELGYGERAAA